MVKSSKTAKLLLDGKEYDLPIMSPTAGPDVLDIRKLYGEAGVFTYDPGFTSTASCDSTITFIDGWHPTSEQLQTQDLERSQKKRPKGESICKSR